MNEPALRKDLPENLCWDLSPLYASEQDWELDFKKLDDLLKKIMACKGHLGESAAIMKQMFEASDEFSMLEERLFVYAHLKHDEDTGNSKNSGRMNRIQAKGSKLSGELAWIEPELLAIDPKRFHELCTDPALAFYKRSLDDIEHDRPHTLSEKEERIISLSSDALSLSESAFSMLNDADLRFPEVSDGKGGKVELTHGNYISLLENPDRSVREEAFNACYDTYKSFRNTFAAILGGTVKTNVLDARLHNFPSALEASLDNDRISPEVYTKLIDTVHANLPSLYRYFALRAKVLNLDKLDMFDLMPPLTANATKNITWDEAVDMVREALAPLGKEYLSIAEHAFTDRWIDVCECRGKRSGAYSSGCYRKPPYLLLNFSGNLDSAFTLAHELGHSMHSYYSDHAQEYHYASYKIFAAEVASTTNEMLLMHSLMQKAESDEFRAGLLSHQLNDIRATVFRQTMFAEFERDIYAMEESGEPLTADTLSEHYLKLNGLYHGPAVINNERIQYEWERIPHFHYDFYVYKYATGLSAAAKLSQDILSGRTDRYLAFLKAGCSKDVLDIMRDAGVDFATPAPVQATMDLFRSSLEQLEKLLLK